jgi:hypothetical protein
MIRNSNHPPLPTRTNKPTNQPKTIPIIIIIIKTIVTVGFVGGSPVLNPTIAGAPVDLLVRVTFASITNDDLVLSIADPAGPVFLTDISSFIVDNAALLGAGGVAQTQARVGVNLSDNRRITDVITGAGNVQIPGLLAFASTVPTAVVITALTGTLTLLDNYHEPIAIHCNVIPQAGVSATTTVTANLEPAVGDADIGAVSGLALSPRAAGDTFTFAVRVNVGTVPAGPLPIELLHRSLVWAMWVLACSPWRVVAGAGVDPVKVKVDAKKSKWWDSGGSGTKDWQVDGGGG